MKLIDADALIAQMEADAEHIEEPIAKMFVYAAINDVKHAPTIVNRLRNDPEAEWVEIIRCKDCKHWREGTAFSYCDKLYGMGVLNALDYMVAEDDYCSMAERRGEQDE